ncbi:MAG: hypothetical protein ABSG59_21700 [Verrucomicrobiota bacterium]|jgi:hypothetical protein
MKHLLTKFRISNALDSGRPLPRVLQEKIRRCPELRRFAQDAAEAHRALRSPPTLPPPDEALRRSIMRALRAPAAPSPSVRPSTAAWLAPASVFAAMALACVWLSVRRPPPVPVPATRGGAQTLAAADRVLDLGGEMSRTMPSAVVAPLSNELACVDLDLRNAARFVLATLP